MNRIRFAIVAAVALIAQGCGSDSKTDAPAAPDPAASSVNSKVVGFKFSTGDFTIPSGDSFTCFYTNTITSQQMNVQGATGTQGKGGHHLTIYYTDQKVPVGHHPCIDAEMVALHQVAGAAMGKEGIIGLPDGYATKVPAGKQMVIQSHYVRTDPGPATVNDDVELQTLAEQDVKQFANAFVIDDGSFNVQPRSMGTSSTDCVVPQDFNVLLLLGHMHELGMHYKLERLDAAGKPSEMIYQTDWDPAYMSHPPVNQYDPLKPLALKKGTTIRQTCEWKNTGDQAAAFPQEMCVMFSYYIPDNGFIVCDAKAVK